MSEESFKKIPLTQNEFALVDTEDYEKLSKYKWQAENHKHTYYAGTTFKDGKRIRMHRYILSAKNGEIVDHINNNGLDNRKSNLRITTQSVNRYNSRKSKYATSGFIGVCYEKQRNKWAASVKFNGKYFRLGRFDTELEAFNARRKFEIENGMLR